MKDKIIKAIHNIESRRGNIRELTTAEIVLELTDELSSLKAGKEVSEEISPRIAKIIIQIRDLFIEAKDSPLDTMDEIWHLLYQIASPNYDKLSDEVWKELEDKAHRDGLIPASSKAQVEAEKEDTMPYDLIVGLSREGYRTSHDDNEH